jgi:alpha-tubulin suppressor-like RCC1 family protein
VKGSSKRSRVGQELAKGIVLLACFGASGLFLQADSLSASSKISGGYQHTLAVQTDGTVWAWGLNNVGQLGDGTRLTRLTPVQVTNLADVVAVVGGFAHSIALKADGTVWAWGWNIEGQLGDGTIIDRLTPIPVPNLAGVVTADAGDDHSLALKADGTVWAWGGNDSGQLGDGTTIDRLNPMQVSNIFGGVVNISAGDHHSLALKSDGTVWAWGRNNYGQCGVFKSTNTWAPVQVIGLAKAVAIGAGTSHSVAIKADGTVLMWGDNTSGMLGDGTQNDHVAPLPTLFKQSPAGYTAMAAGAYHSYALKAGAGGTVCSWGWNMFGQLGNGTASDTNTLAPEVISNLSLVKELAGGSGTHSIALMGDGSAKAWGANNLGQVGDGTDHNLRPWPTPVSCWNRLRAIEAGGRQSLALDSDGNIWAWGDNEYGQLGDGTTTNRSSPIRILSLDSVKRVRTKELHSLALRSDGTVWAWGWNGFGQLGDGTTVDKLSPIRITDLDEVVDICAGVRHSLALKSDGTVWAWGWNQDGQLGDGTIIDKLSPVQVIGLTGVKKIDAGDAYSIALKADGTIWAWGANYDGELGNGTFAPSILPVQVMNLDYVADVVSGSYGHCLALKADGTLWGWGWNKYGQVGDGTTSNRCIPAPVLPDDCTLPVSTGTNIIVVPKDPVTGESPVTVTFSNVIQEGSVLASSSPGAINLPSNFRLIEPFGSYYVTTTAQYDGYITICIHYAEPVGIPEESLRLYHFWDVVQSAGKPPGLDPNFDYTKSGWEDATNAGSPDIINNTICGTVTSLSPFMIGLPMEITGPATPIQVNTQVTLSVPYGHEGSALWDYDDGAIESGAVSKDGTSWIGTHSYSSPGVYSSSLRLMSEDNLAGQAEFRYIVIYDPSAGFVTGGGWIDSPVGAYTMNPGLTGKANFGFVSKYQKGASTPSGTTEFQFKAGDLNFFSSCYDWLVVAGAKAKFKGTGIINGAGSYKFMLTGIDADVNSKDAFTVDRFRIKIWTEDEHGNETVIYDNALGDDADSATTAIGGGSIVVHNK